MIDGTVTPTEDVIYAVVARTAERSSDDMFNLEPLANTVDPELVESFARAEDVTAESELRFHYNDCEVCVDGTGDVTVQQL